MLLGGDEIGRTQRGNNNAYCQDNEISWFDWDAGRRRRCCSSPAACSGSASAHPVFCRRRWFQGRPIHGTGVSDIGWFTPGGIEMSDEDWQAGFAKSLGVFLNGDAIPTPNERGERVVDDSFYVMFNAHSRAADVHAAGGEVGQTLDRGAQHATSRRSWCRKNGSGRESAAARRLDGASLVHVAAAQDRLT